MMTIETKFRCKTMPTPPRNGMVVVPQVITRPSKLSPRPSYASWSSRLSWSGLWSSSNRCRRVMGQRACSSARMATPSLEPIWQNVFMVGALIVLIIKMMNMTVVTAYINMYLWSAYMVHSNFNLNIYNVKVQTTMPYNGSHKIILDSSLSPLLFSISALSLENHL